jgi:predicted ArsR family transcriptional regulator
MDLFDKRVLAALKDGKPRSFTVLLSKMGFSHNTLQRHLERLIAQGLIVREKAAAKSFGRPKFEYHVPSKTKKQVSLALQDPRVELVALPFSRLRHVCRFEKGGHCKETRRECVPQTCPQIRK